jgi:nitrogen fixation protein
MTNFENPQIVRVYYDQEWGLYSVMDNGYMYQHPEITDGSFDPPLLVEGWCLELEDLNKLQDIAKKLGGKIY